MILYFGGASDRGYSLAVRFVEEVPVLCVVYFINNHH